MKAAFVSVALAIGLASAQMEKVPSCAQDCIGSPDGSGKIGGCGQFDIECICSNDDFLDNVACCLQDECDEKGQKQAIEAAKQICSTAGVTPPDKVECKKDSGSGSGSGSGSDDKDDDKDDDKKDDDKDDDSNDNDDDDDNSGDSDSAEDSNNSDDSDGDGNGAAGTMSLTGAIGAAVAMLFAL